MGLEGFSGTSRSSTTSSRPAASRSSATSSRSSATSGCPTRTRTATSRRDRARGRPGHRPAAADVEQRRRDLALPAGREDGDFFRNGEGDEVVFVHEGSGTLETIFGDLPYGTGDYVVVPRGTTYRFRRRAAALPGVRDARPDHDPEALPQRVRPADGARAVLPPRHPPADRAADDPRAGRVRGQGARPRRLPGLRPRLPPVRRRRLGRLPLPVDVLDPRLRADHGADPHAAALAPDLPGPELRDLLVLPAQARLRPAGGADPVPPLEPPERGDDLLRRRELRSRRGIEVGSITLHPPACRTGRSPGSPRSRSG